MREDVGAPTLALHVGIRLAVNRLVDDEPGVTQVTLDLGQAEEGEVQIGRLSPPIGNVHDIVAHLKARRS